MSDANVVPLRSGNKIAPIIPQTIEEIARISDGVVKSGLGPRGMTKEQCMVAIMHGLEIGLPPMMSVQKIAVVNGRPTLWGDAVPAILLAKGFRLHEEIEVGPNGQIASCTVTRPDGDKITRTFSEADARKAGLWGKAGPWQQYPQRMLAMRARAFAARDGAADALSGLYVSEEMQDVIDVTPTRKSSAQAKRDGDDAIFNDICREFRQCSTLEELDAALAKHEKTLETMPGRWEDLVQGEYETRAQDLRAEAPQE